MSVDDAWRPFHDGPKALPLSATPLDKEAVALWQKVLNAREYVAQVQKAEQDLIQELQCVHAEYEAEMERAGQAGEVSTLGPELLAKRDQLEAQARSDLHPRQQSAAKNALEKAERTYLGFLADHTLEFLAEMAPEAEKVAAEYVKVSEEVNARLRPIEQRHRDLLNAVRVVVGNNEHFRPADLPAPTEYRQPPLPSAEAMARVLAAHDAHAARVAASVAGS